MKLEKVRGGLLQPHPIHPPVTGASFSCFVAGKRPPGIGAGGRQPRALDPPRSQDENDLFDSLPGQSALMSSITCLAHSPAALCLACSMAPDFNWVPSSSAPAHLPTRRAAPGPSRHGAKHGICQIYRNEPWPREFRLKPAHRGCLPRYAGATHHPRTPRRLPSPHTEGRHE